MPDRRLRDMSLTEDEASRRAYAYIFDYYQTVPPYRASRYLNILDRAKRLLPLWRQWGLQALYNQGHRAACEEYEKRLFPPKFEHEPIPDDAFLKLMKGSNE